MDTENKHSNEQNHAPTDHDTSFCGCTASTPPTDTATPTMAELMQRAPIPGTLCDWVACMRKAGISLTYSLKKEHIPDMNAAPTGMAAPTTSGGRSAGQSDGQASGNAGGTCTGRSGGQAPVGSVDNMSASGTCRIRYFDLALGAMGIFAACMLVKCCCCMKHKLF